MKFNKDLTKGLFEIDRPLPRPLRQLTFQISVSLLRTNVATLHVWISWKLFTSLPRDALDQSTGGGWGGGSEQMTAIVIILQVSCEMESFSLSYLLTQTYLRTLLPVTETLSFGEPVHV